MIAFGHVTVGVDISRMASSAATMKTAAPATASLGPSSVPISEREAAEGRERDRRGAANGLGLDVSHRALATPSS